MPLTFSSLLSYPNLFVPASPSDSSFPYVVGVHREQPELVGPQVMVPEPDRRGLMQDGGDPGVRALFAQPRIVPVSRRGQYQYQRSQLLPVGSISRNSDHTPAPIRHPWRGRA